MIEVKNLVKTFEGFCALKGVSFKVNKGEIFGFIGPNGAGKTTTIRILSTLSEPTSGDAFISGFSVTNEPEEVHRFVGYMPDFFGVITGLTVREYLDFFARAYEIPNPRRDQLILDVLELTDLIYKREAFVETLSKGMKQRLCLAKTLIHDPTVLLLDEPASGLDPRARIEMKELIKELQKMGKTVLISSHILSELADFCTHIGIIERGEMIVCEQVEKVLQMGNQSGSGELGEKIDLMYRLRLLGDVEAGKKVLEELGWFSEITEEHKGGYLTLKGNIPDDQMPAVLSEMLTKGLKVAEFSIREAKLEDVFVRVTKGLVQ